MRVYTHSDASTLVERCKDLLSQQQAINNNLLHLMHMLANGSSLLGPPYWCASIEDNGQVLGCCIHTEPDGLVFSEIPETALELLCEAAYGAIDIPKRIVGTPVLAKGLAEKFELLGGRKAKIGAHWHIYKLDNRPNADALTSGDIRRADESDVSFVEECGIAFGEEQSVFLDTRSFMLDKLRSNELFIWDDRGPKSLVTISGSKEAGYRISAVFAPKRWRGQGYATSAIVSICQILFDRGADDVVMTATINSPSERLYKRIGFSIAGRQTSYELLDHRRGD